MNGSNPVPLPTQPSAINLVAINKMWNNRLLP